MAAGRHNVTLVPTITHQITRASAYYDNIAMSESEDSVTKDRGHAHTRTHCPSRIDPIPPTRTHIIYTHTHARTHTHTLPLACPPSLMQARFTQ